MSATSSNDPIPFISLSWVKAATRCGFNIEPIFRRLGIEADLEHATIRQPQLVQLMDACVAQARQQHFPFVLGDTFAFDYLPDIETFLTTSPTLRESLRVFDWVRALINPMLRVHLEESGRQARLVLDIFSADPAQEPRHYFAEAVFATIIKFSRMMLGSKSIYHELWFKHSAPPYAAEYEKFFGVPVCFNRPKHALLFERALLDRPLEGAFPALHRQAEYLVERRITQMPRRDGAVAAVDRLLGEHPELLGRGIERVADALGMHPRTLQRRLREEGKTFAAVLAQARFRAASEMLKNGDDDIELISERLGFSDRRSFTRAFTRWAGTSPSVFRRKPAISQSSDR
jgi:AraC-like DNA-binding protein